MDEYGPSTYGDRIAKVYDEWFPESSRAGDVDAAVSFLREPRSLALLLEHGDRARTAQPDPSADGTAAALARSRLDLGPADDPGLRAPLRAALHLELQQMRRDRTCGKLV